MTSLDGPLRLLAVHAHPDDESSKGAASMARYLSEGARVLVATCTDGSRGSVLNSQLKDREAELMADIVGVRRREMEAAAAIIGFEHEWLGFVDSGYPEKNEETGELPPLPAGCFGLQPVEVASRPLVELVRRFRPHVITTYDEEGGYPHPDHVMTHVVAMEAWEKAGDPDAYPGTGEPWTPQKLYYHQTFHKARLLAMNGWYVDQGLESPYKDWLDRWEDKPEHEGLVTTQVECADWFDVRDKALLAHATQVDPTGAWFRTPLDVQRQIWPTEDYTLARARVETSTPEDDLFAGVRLGASV